MSDEAQNNQLAVMPSQVMDLMKPDQIMQAGQLLKWYAEKNGLITKIANKDYCQVSGWQFAGSQFGLSAIPSKPVRISDKENLYIIFAKIERSNKAGTNKWMEEIPVYSSTVRWTPEDLKYFRDTYKVSRELMQEYFNYECSSRIIRLADQQLIGEGHATCSNLEHNKITFAEYAINSMSQTRAIGKGYRNLLSFVMNAAGLETTPLEEMEGTDEAREPVKVEELKVLTDEQLDRTIAALQEGRITLETVRKFYQLPQEHEDKINAALGKQTSQPAQPAEASTQPAQETKRKRFTPPK